MISTATLVLRVIKQAARVSLRTCPLYRGIPSGLVGIALTFVYGLIMGLFQHGVDILGRGLRLVQSGSIQTYAFLFVVGVALVIYIVLGGTH